MDKNIQLYVPCTSFHRNDKKLEGRRMHYTWISTSYLSYSNLIELQIILAEGLK